MELYRKKINIKNKRPRDKYQKEEYSQGNNDQNTYLREMLRKKAVSQPRNEALNISSENLQNVRSSLEDILADENNKKKAIKYVIQIGKNKKIPSSYDNDQRYEKTDMRYCLINDVDFLNNSFDAVPVWNENTKGQF